MRATLALLAGLVLVAAVPAGGYTYHNGYYMKGNNAYNRVQYYQPGYSYCAGGYSYYQQPYYYYSYEYDHTVKEEKKEVTPKVPEYGPDWQTEMVKYAKERDNYATYLRALNLLGVQGQTYSFQQGYASPYNSYAPNTSLAYAAQGNTQFGYGAKQVLDFYGALDLNAAFQQSARGMQGAQEAASAANESFSERLKQALAGQTRAAEILAEGEARRKVEQGSQLTPGGRLEFQAQASARSEGNNDSGDFGHGAGGDNVPPPQGGMDDAHFLALRQQRCGGCHSGAEAKAKLDLTKPWNSYDPQLRATIMDRITTVNPEKRMPKTKEGKPADLPLAEKMEFLRRTQ